MRLLLIFLILLSSCTKNVEQPLLNMEKADLGFMDSERIISEMNMEFDVLNEELFDADYIRRVDNLIPEKVFLMGIEDEQEAPTLKGMEMSIPASVDLREWDTPVKNQNNGYCTAYATAAGMEATLCKRNGLCNQDLSEQYLFDQYRLYNTSASIEAANKNLQVDEQYWPQYGRPAANIKQYGHAQLLSYRYLGTSVDRAMEAISNGNYVVVALQTPNDMLNGRAVIRTTTTFSKGGHAILMVGYEKTDKVAGGMYGTIKNSWGSTLGDRGYQYVPLAHICFRSGSYCYFWELMNVTSTKVSNPNLPIVPLPLPQPKNDPVWKLYCTPVSWSPATWRTKKNRCTYWCIENCASVCNGASSCSSPY